MNKNTLSFQQLAVILCSIAFIISFSASAQDLKPAKDKATKKYGYQYKGQKNWVIQPQFDDAKKFVDGFAEVELNGLVGLIDISGNPVFPAAYDKIGKFDRNGYCELMRKVDGVKLHGIADRSGRIIIPVECRDVSMDYYGEFLYAKYDSAIPGFDPEPLWGVYDMNGREIFKPQFPTTPNFKNGVGIVKSATSGLYGLIGRGGNVIKPFEFLQINRTAVGFEALGTDYSHHIWSEDAMSSQVLRQIGAIIPYDPKDDPVRVAAWHKGPIGMRLYHNSVKRVDIHLNYAHATAVCTELPVDWGFGYGRFIRLEPTKVSQGTPNAMYYGSTDSYYTLKAKLYEPDGTLVSEVCGNGWIEGLCNEGAIYNAGGYGLWMIFANPNTLAVPAFTMNIAGYQPVDHKEIFSGLDITIAELKSLKSRYTFTERIRDIYETENVGVCSYMPRIPSDIHARAEYQASHSPLFRHHFCMGDVVNCDVIRKDDKVRLKLSKDLVCFYRDRLDDPFYTAEGREELIFWGPNNMRTVRLNPVAVIRSDKYTNDDRYGTGYSFMLALDMYEEDGTWLRTLATAPWVDFVKDGILVFEELGIAMITPYTGSSAFKPHILPGKQQPNNHQPGNMQQHQQQQPGTQQPADGSGHAVVNRNGKPARGTTQTTVQGGSRQSVGGVGGATTGSTPETPEGKRVIKEDYDLTTALPHTLSALESAFDYR